MKDFELVEDGELLIFEKRAYDFKNDDVPMLGWVLKKHLLLWINYNSGAKNIYQVKERPEINPDHLTLNLIKDGKELLIGWLDRKRLKELDDSLFEFYKTKQVDRTVEKMHLEEPVQLSLFG